MVRFWWAWTTSLCHTLLNGLKIIGAGAFLGAAGHCMKYRYCTNDSGDYWIRTKHLIVVNHFVNIELHERRTLQGWTRCLSLLQITISTVHTFHGADNRVPCLVEIELQEGRLQCIDDKTFRDCISLCTVPIPSTRTTEPQCFFSGRTWFTMYLCLSFDYKYWAVSV